MITAIHPVILRPVYPTPPTWGAWYWPVTLVLIVLLFFPAEVYALFTNVGNTLSDYSRGQLHEYSNEPLFKHVWQWWVSQVIFAASVVWLMGHIWYNTWG